MNASELAQREIIDLDIAKDPLPANKYQASEDPTLVGSMKANRGPWVPDTWKTTANPVMCVYKLVRAEFAYFGLQGTIESTIRNSQQVLFLHSHRRMLAWMDEWSSVFLFLFSFSLTGISPEDGERVVRV